jgi:hypothetical protein
MTTKKPHSTLNFKNICCNISIGTQNKNEYVLRDMRKTAEC